MSAVDRSVTPSESRTPAFLALTATVTCWGIGWPVNRAIFYHLTPLTAVTLRSAIAAVALFAIAGWQGRLTPPSRQDLPVVFSIALLHMVGFSVLVAIGLLFVPVGRSIVLGYTTPLWVTPGAALFLHEKLTARRGLGVLLGLGGLAVLFNPLAFDWHDEAALFGNAVLLVAALLWAASILHIRAHRWQAAPFDLLPWEMALATLVLAALTWARDGWPAAEWTQSLVLLALYSALPGSALAFWGAAVAARSLPAVTTSLGLLAAPVIGLVASAIIFGEQPTLSLGIAVAMIIGGIALGTIASGEANQRD